MRTSNDRWTYTHAVAEPRGVDAGHQLGGVVLLQGREQRRDLRSWEVIRGVQFPPGIAPGDPGVVHHLPARRQWLWRWWCEHWRGASVNVLLLRRRRGCLDH